MKFKGFGDELTLEPENNVQLKALNDFLLRMQQGRKSRVASATAKIRVMKSEGAFNEFSFSIEGE